MSQGASVPPKLHELNQGFAWQDVRGPFRCITAEQAEQYNRDGYFLLEGAIDAPTVARLIEEIDPIEARVEAFLRQQEGGRFLIARANEITFSTHLVTHSLWLREFVANPLFRALMHDLLGPDVRLYWDQAVYKKPGTVAPFPWHQDNGYAFIEPQQYVTCWIALSDTDPDSGCPWVLPGLHRHGTLRHESSDLGFVCFEDPQPKAVPVAARAGDIVVFSSLTPHTTGPNLGEHVRRAYIVQYAPEGAEVLSRSAQGPATRKRADDPAYQFPVLTRGEAVAHG